MKSKAQLDQDITPSESNKLSNLEHRDSEGNKYLNYKSISGMDCVPRFREPTPPKLKKNARESLDEMNDVNPSCGGCRTFKVRYNNIVAENSEMKTELELLRT